MPDVRWWPGRGTSVAKVSKLLTLDNKGKNSTQAGFDASHTVQYRFPFGYENHPNYWVPSGRPARSCMGPRRGLHGGHPGGLESGLAMGLYRHVGRPAYIPDNTIIQYP